MHRVVTRCKRFTLVQTDDGFAWEMKSGAGTSWYWNAGAAEWTCNRHWSHTQEEASVGLDWTLRHEEAGDLNQQHQGARAGGPVHGHHLR